MVGAGTGEMVDGLQQRAGRRGQEGDRSGRVTRGHGAAKPTRQRLRRPLAAGHREHLSCGEEPRVVLRVEPLPEALERLGVAAHVGQRCGVGDDAVECGEERSPLGPAERPKAGGRGERRVAFAHRARQAQDVGDRVDDRVEGMGHPGGIHDRAVLPHGDLARLEGIHVPAGQHAEQREIVLMKGDWALRELPQQRERFLLERRAEAQQRDPVVGRSDQRLVAGAHLSNVCW